MTKSEMISNAVGMAEYRMTVAERFHDKLDTLIEQDNAAHANQMFYTSPWRSVRIAFAQAEKCLFEVSDLAAKLTYVDYKEEIARWEKDAKASFDLADRCEKAGNMEDAIDYRKLGESEKKRAIEIQNDIAKKEQEKEEAREALYQIELATSWLDTEDSVKAKVQEIWDDTISKKQTKYARVSGILFTEKEITAPTVEPAIVRQVEEPKVQPKTTVTTKKKAPVNSKKATIQEKKTSFFASMKTFLTNTVTSVKNVIVTAAKKVADTVVDLKDKFFSKLKSFLVPKVAH